MSVISRANFASNPATIAAAAAVMLQLGEVLMEASLLPSLFLPSGGFASRLFPGRNFVSSSRDRSIARGILQFSPVTSVRGVNFHRDEILGAVGSQNIVHRETMRPTDGPFESESRETLSATLDFNSAISRGISQERKNRFRVCPRE